MEDFKIPEAIIDPKDPTYATSPLGVRFKIQTFGPKHWWWCGGKVPILELLKPIDTGGKKKGWSTDILYFAVPFFYFDQTTGHGRFFESSLAPGAFPMVQGGYAKVVGYETFEE